jgi:hypothetical protein
MDSEPKHSTVIYERWLNGAYQGRWIYKREGYSFGISDVPQLFEQRPYKQQETSKTEYLFRESEEGLHIALFYGGFPGNMNGDA